VVLHNKNSISEKLRFLSPTVVATVLEPKDLHSLSSIGFVKDMVMWELGNNAFVAVSSIYLQQKIVIFKLDLSTKTWSLEKVFTNEPNQKQLGEVVQLKVFKFFSSTEEIVHLFVARDSAAVDIWSSGFSEMWVYKQTRNLAKGVISTMEKTDNSIATPGLRDFEVILFQDSKEDSPVIHLFLAQNVKFDFGPDFAMLMTLHYDVSSGQYAPAVLPNSIQEFGIGLVKLQAASVANFTVLIAAGPHELNTYSFVPYKGLTLVDSVKTGGKVLDFAVFNKRVIGEELHIYVLEENMKTKLFKLVTKDSVPHLSLTYGRYLEFN